MGSECVTGSGYGGTEGGDGSGEGVAEDCGEGFRDEEAGGAGDEVVVEY